MWGVRGWPTLDLSPWGLLCAVPVAEGCVGDSSLGTMLTIYTPLSPSCPGGGGQLGQGPCLQ